MAAQACPVSNDFRLGRCAGRCGLPRLSALATAARPIHRKREDATTNAGKSEADNTSHATFNSEP